MLKDKAQLSLLKFKCTNVKLRKQEGWNICEVTVNS